jgi:YVTN family beta-propeller protein
VGTPDIPISTHDRVYAANQTSNTVSVIDPSTNQLLGLIRLGDPVPGSLGRSTEANYSYMVLATLLTPGTLAVVSIALELRSLD